MPDKVQRSGTGSNSSSASVCGFICLGTSEVQINRNWRARGLFWVSVLFFILACFICSAGDRVAFYFHAH